MTMPTTQQTNNLTFIEPPEVKNFDFDRMSSMAISPKQSENNTSAVMMKTTHLL